MKVALTVALMAASLQAVGQEAKPIKSFPFLMDRTDLILATADLGLRVGDMYTTNRNLRNPCNCYFEADPIAPSGTKGIVLFQLGMWGVGQVARYELERHGHRKLAKLLVVDVASEAFAVVNNATLRPGLTPPVETGWQQLGK